MGSPRTILIVDDEAQICGILDEFLTGQGYTVTTAMSGEEGLLTCEHEGPDVVVLDVRLPGVSGLDVLRTLRARGTTTRVIMMTAFDDEATREEARQLGADAYLTKPFHLHELEERLGGTWRGDEGPGGAGN